MNPPKYFDVAERTIWREIVKSSHVQITAADAPALEILVMLLHKQRTRMELSANERTTLLRLLMEFRGTPASRSKITLPPEAPNEFATL